MSKDYELPFYWEIDKIIARQRYSIDYYNATKEQQAVIHSYREALAPYIVRVIEETAKGSISVESETA